MNMREKIARAVFSKISEGQMPKKYWEVAPREVRLFCYGIVDACLEALSEPTEAMLRSGGPMFDANVYMGGATQRAKDKASQCYQAMIEAAKNSDLPVSADEDATPE